MQRMLLRRLKLCEANLWKMILQQKGELRHGSPEALPPVPVRSGE